MLQLKNWIPLPNGCLHGVIYGHPIIADGSQVQTEQVTLEGETVARSARNTYELSEPYDCELDAFLECDLWPA